MFGMKFKVDGMDSLIKSLKRLGEVPQKHVTASVRKAMGSPLKQAKADAPEDTGALKKGIVLKGEKSKTKGKKIYRIVFDDSMNDIFQKARMVTKKNGTQTERVTGYYPVSQEYGWFTRSGSYIPGLRFARGAMESKAGLVSRTIISTMAAKISQELRKAGLH